MPNSASSLAIFDLDNTLLAGDSDHAWGEFLCANGHVDAQQHQQLNDQFYQAYCDGDLDIDAYLKFALSAIAGKTPAELSQLHADFMQQFIQPMRLKKADALLQQHRKKGDFLLIITATNDFITAPIAQALGVDDLIASQAEIINGVYTGKPTGIPSFQDGKVARLKQWLSDRDFSLEAAYFYSDSHNDLPLLSAVGHPIAVDADETLQQHAVQMDWPSISLREVNI